MVNSKVVSNKDIPIFGFFQLLKKMLSHSIVHRVLKVINYSVEFHFQEWRLVMTRYNKPVKVFWLFYTGGSKSAPLKLNAIKLPNILKVRVQAVS